MMLIGLQEWIMKMKTKIKTKMKTNAKKTQTKMKSTKTVKNRT